MKLVPAEGRALLGSLICAVVLLGVAAPIIAIAYPIEHIAKKQDRLLTVVVPHMDDPWIVKVVPTITFRKQSEPEPLPEGYFNEAHEALAIKPVIEPKPEPKAKKKEKRSEAVPEEVIRKATQKALLSYAKAQIGKRGPQLGLPSSLWCADFINWTLKKVGLKGSGSRLARSFLRHPNFVRVTKPAPGDIVVMARGRGNISGHVAFHNGKCLLGGNQGGRRVTNWCGNRRNIIGYVRPKTIPPAVIARLT